MTPVPLSDPARTADPARPGFAANGFSTTFKRAAAVLAATLVTATVIGPATHAEAAVTLLSQDRPTYASSLENGGTAANAAVDGNTTTRWASQPSDAQWLEVDLGFAANITQVVLRWENAYGKSFQIQTSADDLTWTNAYTTTTGPGGAQTLDVTGTGRFVRLNLTQRGTGYGYSLWEFQVYGSYVALPTSGWVLANPQVTTTASQANPPHAYFHEFQTNCSVVKDLPDDPIVFPGQPGASHMHTFMGNLSTNANSTLASLQAATSTSCLAPGDKAAYWMPTMYKGSTAVEPVGPQVIYYKTNLIDYTSVRTFPLGLRYVVNTPKTNALEFMNFPGVVEGWECGESYHNADFPLTCPAGTQVNIRLQAPSCWDGKYLDTPDHIGHMAYPVNGRCTISHPVALPMIEFKMAFPAGTDLSQIRLSSGRGYSFHYDFFNAWDPATLAAMVTHCIVGGLQCDPHGYDQEHPEKGAVLNAQYQLP